MNQQITLKDRWVWEVIPRVIAEKLAEDPTLIERINAV